MANDLRVVITSIQIAMNLERAGDLAKNIAKIILKMCEEKLGETVRPGGRAIFSGIIETQIEEVEAALRKTGLEPLARYQQGDWILVEARRPV